MHPGTDNRASTVLRIFLQATEACGVPSRVRGDRGGENVEMAVWMIQKRGPNRASFMWGSYVPPAHYLHMSTNMPGRSTHNTRIERLWVEVGRVFVRGWRAFFTRLERIGCLNRQDPEDLWFLHTLFLPLIVADCKAFEAQWNAHPISGTDTQNQSPNVRLLQLIGCNSCGTDFCFQDLFFLGQLEHGIYTDDSAAADLVTVAPSVLSQFYGTTAQHPRRPLHHTGAGHDPEEDGILDAQQLADSLHSSQVRHEPVAVPQHRCSFTSEEELTTFFQTLEALEDQKHIPQLYGLLPGETDAGEYGSVEILRSGRRGGKELTVSLPVDVWRPRAETWARAHSLMHHMLYASQDNV
jgi:hypothetical protein